MNDLFPVEVSLSPKLQWMRRHGVITEYIGMRGCESPETGDDLNDWICRIKNPRFQSGLFCPNEIGDGETEDEAIMDFCQNSGIKHWTLQ